MNKKDWIKRSKKRRYFDWKLFFLACGLSLFGVVMVYNASVIEAFQVFGDKYYFLKNQLLWLGIGVAVMIVFSQIDYHHWRRIGAPLFFLNLVLLGLVLIPGIGSSIKGARRWLNLGFFILQPSELIKLTLTVYLSSWLLVRRKFFHFLCLMAVVGLLIAFEPDLGTLVVIIANAFLLYYLSGASLFNLLALAILGLATGLLLIFASDYRRTRFLTFLDLDRDPLGSSYHIQQVLVAFGTGGFFGLGLGQSRQKYMFLPEATTDSIFAIIAEELGFLGAGIVVLVFLFLVLRGLLISRRAPDKFGQLLAGGITGWLAFQAFINLAAMVALLPLTGLPLPFISYGGSSLIVALTGIGILLNIAKNSA